MYGVTKSHRGKGTTQGRQTSRSTHKKLILFSIVSLFSSLLPLSFPRLRRLPLHPYWKRRKRRKPFLDVQDNGTALGTDTTEQKRRKNSGSPLKCLAERGFARIGQVQKPVLIGVILVDLRHQRGRRRQCVLHEHKDGLLRL